jgi:uncharacterized protein YjbJ (UPF0337 family)
MNIRKEDILEAASDRAKTVAHYGTAAWDEAVERITPLLEAAAKKVGPVADDAIEAAKGATRKAAGLAADTVERIQPTVNSALDKVSPAVDRAQKAVQEDILPKMIRVLHQAAATPAGTEAREILARLDERADASLSTLKSELGKSKKGSSPAKRIATLAAVGAILGALALAVRTFLGSREEWAAYEPDEPYVYPDDDYEIDEVLADLDEVIDEATQEAEVGDSRYGEGSYVGTNPPEGFEIKGNERSMKYHVPGAAGYARTTAEVWFASEEAAQAAGFARSQR